MKISIVDAQWLRENKRNCPPAEMAFKSNRYGHKYEIGENRTLVGLEDFSEFNGETVEITGYREDGYHGKAYYIKGSINEYLNWVYEYRLC